MAKHKHDWHLYDFTRASLITIDKDHSQVVEARFNFVCGECGATKHHPPIQDSAPKRKK